MNVGELNGPLIRRWENDSIRAFVQKAADQGCFRGRVLDYGCGKQPYRPIVQAAGGEYHAYDRSTYPGSIAPGDIGDPEPLREPWDAILCNQVVNYILDPSDLLVAFRRALDGGYLVLTGASTWMEIGDGDVTRFTRHGITMLLENAGFREIHVEDRFTIKIPYWPLSLGWGVIAS